MKKIIIFLIVGLFISCSNTIKFENNEYFQQLSLDIVTSWLRENGAIFRVDKDLFNPNTIVFNEEKSSETILTYDIQLPIVLTKENGSRVDAFFSPTISISKNEPETKYKFSHTTSENIKYWINYYKVTGLSQREFDRERSIRKLKKEIMEIGILGTLDGISIINNNPLHIQVSEWVFETSLTDIIIEENERAIAFVTLMTFIYSDFNEVQITGVPQHIKSIKPGNITKGEILTKYKKDIFITRTDLLTYLKGKFEVDSFYDLVHQETILEKNIVKGVLEKEYDSLLYNDQGGVTLNSFFNFLVKTSKEK